MSDSHSGMCAHLAAASSPLWAFPTYLGTCTVTMEECAGSR